MGKHLGALPQVSNKLRLFCHIKSRTLAPSVWQPTALKPVVPVLRDRYFECVYVYIVIVVSKCVCHLHNKELLYFIVFKAKEIGSPLILLHYVYYSFWLRASVL